MKNVLRFQQKHRISEMVLPGAIALIAPVLVGFGFKGVFAETSSAEMLGGLFAGVTVSGVLMGIFQNNAGGAWDNAKKSFEEGVEIDGKMEYKGSEAHKASVTGDTVGDPFKDTSGPSMNILIKLTSIVALIIAPHIAVKPVQKIETPASQTIEAPAKANVSGVFKVNSADNATFTWVAKKVGSQHNGSLNGFGKIKMENNLVEAGQFELDMTSIKVLDINDPESNQKLTNHLKSDDFFASAKYPTSVLTVESSSEDQNGTYVFDGKLTIKGITKPTEGVYNVIKRNGSDYVTGALNFDRTAYDIRFRSGKFFEELGDKLIYDDVLVGFEFKI